MNYYFDTEFIEDGRTIDLISIGMVAENGNTLYEISSEFNVDKASDWVCLNVLEPMFKDFQLSNATSMAAHIMADEQLSRIERIKQVTKGYIKFKGRSRARIAELVKEFVNDNLQTSDDKPVFYAYYADYDWVVFCQLFGTMMDLPEGFPMYCRDLKQELDRIAVIADWRYPEKWLEMIKAHSKYPTQENEHDALADAKWNQKLHHFMATL